MGLIDSQMELTIPPRTFLLLACIVGSPPAPAALVPPCPGLVDDLDLRVTSPPDPQRCSTAATAFLAFAVSEVQLDETTRVAQVEALTSSFDVGAEDRQGFEDDATALRQADRSKELGTLDRYLAACLTS